jgi:hypothetical protein
MTTAAAHLMPADPVRYTDLLQANCQATLKTLLFVIMPTIQA